MNSTVKIILVVIAAAAACFGAYHLYQYFHVFTTKQEAAAYLETLGKDYNLLLEFDEPFVIAWANAAHAGESFFTYKKQSHSSKTGKFVGS